MDYQKIYDLMLEVHADQKWEKEQFEKMNNKINDLSVDVKYLLTMMQGNGKPGVIARINILEAEIEQSKPRSRSWIKQFVGCLFILAIITGTVYSVASEPAPQEQIQSK